MKFQDMDGKKLFKFIIAIAIICILVFLGAQNFSALKDAVAWVFGLFSPLIIGCAIAVILNVPMRFFEERFWVKAKKPIAQKLRRPVAYLLSLIIIIAVLTGVVMLVIPELIEAVKVLIGEAIELVKTLSVMSKEEISALPLGSVLLKIDWNGLLAKLQTYLTEQSGAIINTAINTAVGTVGGLAGGIFNFFMAFVFSVYLLFGKELLRDQFCRLIRIWLPEGKSEWFIHACSVTGENFRNFISGQTLEAVILGVLCMVGMWIFGFPYAPMVGALVGVTALVPVIGGFIGAGVGAFMILTIDPLKAVIFVLYIIILQQIEGNLIYPKVMGTKVSLPSMWILAAVTVGGGLGGPIGMLLAVPIASTAYILIGEATNKREQARAEAVKAEQAPKEEAEEVEEEVKQ